MTTRHHRFKVGRAVSALAGLVTVCGLATACGGGSAGTSNAADSSASASGGNSSELQALYKKAKAAGETEVTVYQAANPVFQPLRDAFAKQFPGITVNGVSIIGAPAQARLQAEFTTGKHSADLVQSGLSDVVPEEANGWFESYVPSTASTVPAKQVSPKKDFIESSEQLYGVLYNKSQVQKSDVPTKWSDLLSSKWKGKLGLADPTASNGSTQAIMAALYNKVWTHSDIQALAALQPKNFAASAEEVSAVATGQVPLGIFVPYDQYQAQAQKGAPIGFGGLLDKGNPVLPLATALVKGAPHPDAAKLYEAWLFSPQAQSLLASAVGQYSTVPGAPSPKGAPAMSKVHALRLPPYDQLQSYSSQVLADNAKVFSH